MNIPNKLYGRDRDIATLLESFERISGGHGEVLLVPGASGVGKTALVRELQGPIRNRNGFFIRGKFDQYQQNIPYFAFRQALAELCRELQSADANQRSRFKTEILQAVGNLGQVLVGLVPEFGAFLGAQPPLEAISPQEARHRLADVCRSFLKVICWPEHPLVLFIDDWQWADVASCELLKQMQVGTTLRYLLVIASYRDNEVDPGHAFMSAVADLRSQAVPVAELHVKNITAEDVREFVADTLKPAAEDVAALAAFIHAKTLGNPFFVRSFLGFLHDVHLIGFDPARNCWQWSMDKIGGADLPDDVVGLFILKLRRLDQDSRNLFSLAACLGNRFDLDALGIISGHTSEECQALLCSEQANALILPVDNDGGSFDAATIRAPRACLFVHDRIQQAAYSLIEPAELPKLLLKIGRLLLASLSPEQLAEQLFEVVGDLNAGSHLMTDAAEQEKVLELNLTAARKAYAATAYRSALQFYRAAARFLETPGFAGHLWRDRYELTLRYFKERAGCEFLAGNLTEAEQYVQQAVAHAGTAIEKAEALSILIVQYTLLARYPEAIAAGRQALAALGIHLPEADYEKARNEEIARVRRELVDRPVSSLIELPVMSDPAMLMASKILITLGPPCYRSHQRLWSVIVPKVVNLTLRYGNIPQIGYSHTAFGGLLGWVDDDYATAKEFGELATRLMTDTFRAPTDQSVFYLMIGSSIRHWFQHLRHGTQDYHDAYEIGLRSGNLQYAAYAFGHDMYCRFYQGAPLAGLIQETQRSLAFSRTRRNQWAIDLLEGGLNIFGALSGESPALNGNDAWSETDFLRRVADHHNIQVTCIYKVLQTFSLLLAGHHEDALALSDETEPLIYTVGSQGLLPWPEHVFARLLILTALYAKADEKCRTQWRAELDRMQGRLRIWADNGPDNFEHKYLLAAAELARIDGRPSEAIPLYDQAVAAARAGNFLQWEGLANERAHDFWLERGNERLAHVYWQQAYVCFSRWGAAAKVGSMETACRALLVKNLPAGAGSGKLEPEIETALVERQIKQLRDQASQAQHARLRGEAAVQAEELAHAMQRVRVEIAERKRAEVALRESEAMLNETGRMARVGGWTINLEQGTLKWTREVYVIHEVSEDYQPAVATAINFYTPEARLVIQRAVEQAIQHGESFDLDLELITARGRRIWVRTIGSTVVENGKTQAVSGTFQDITARKLAEAEQAQLEAQNQQLQKAESLGRMAGAIAHHFNNKLQAVMGYLELAMGDLTPSAKPLETLNEAMQAARQAATLSGDMLTYLGETSSQLVPLDFSESCRQGLHLIQVTKPSNVTLVTTFAAPGAIIHANANQLHQVLNNLVTNAWEAIGDKPGTVNVVVTTVTPTEIPAMHHPIEWQPQAAAYACLEVADTGCGIAGTDIGKIYDPFFTTRFAGRGLGLAIVLGLVRSSGGAVTVESVLGQGSTFRVYFPISAQAVPHLPAPAASALPFTAGGTVLLVEDEKAIRELAAKVLTSFGFTVLAAQDGREALEIFQQQPATIRCVLTDLSMPRMGGWETLTALRDLRPDLPVVLVSGYDEASVTRGDHHEKPHAFLFKPYSIAGLRNALGMALGTVPNNQTEA